MATRNVNLTKQLDQFVEQKVATGEFQNASEVVRAGLRLLSERDEDRAAKIEALKSAIQVGLDDLDRGDFEVVDDIEAWANELGRRAGD
jgi:antitoxin ParD1/3/4